MDFLKVNDTAVLMFKDASGHALASVSIDLSRLSAAGSMASNSNDLIIAYEGQNVLDGKAGDDILVDNTGTQFLTGGQGRDRFVLGEDGGVDYIKDFSISEDTLDLSLWMQFYSLDRLEIVSTQKGASLSFGDEVLHITTSTGQSLDAEDFEGINVIFLSRYTITVQPLESSEPTKTPNPLGNGTTLSPEEEATIFPIPPDENSEYPDLSSPVYVPTTGAYYMNSLFNHLELNILNLNPTGEYNHGLPVLGTQDSDGINGTYRSEYIHGLAGHDVIFALGGHDLLDGGAGQDRLYGGSGDDTLVGGFGEDLLTGGVWRDVFVFYPTKGGERDVIADFDVNRDKISISKLIGNDDQAKYDTLIFHTVGDNLWIDVHGQAIILYAIDASDLNVSHFIFE